MDLSKFANPNSMALMGLAQGLFAGSGASPREITLGEAMGMGMGGAMQGMMAGQDMQFRQQENQMRQQQLQRQLDMKTTLQELTNTFRDDLAGLSKGLLSSGYPELMDMGLKMRPKVKRTVESYDESGKPIYHNVMEDGSTSATGISVARPFAQVNTGGQIHMVDPFNPEIRRGSFDVTMAPGEAARLRQSADQFAASHGLAQQNAGLAQQKLLLDTLRMKQELDPDFQAQKQAKIAQGREQGKIQAKAQADLPNAIMQGEQTIKLVDDLLAHPGFNISVGKSAPIGKLQSMIPGTQAASFDIALNQLKGKQFLEAFESLKGGGQITQIEGEKATQAMSRMEKANTEEEFQRAAREFQSIIRTGIARAKSRAGVQTQSAPQTSNDGWGDLR